MLAALVENIPLLSFHSAEHSYVRNQSQPQSERRNEYNDPLNDPTSTWSRYSKSRSTSSVAIVAANSPLFSAGQQFAFPNDSDLRLQHATSYYQYPASTPGIYAAAPEQNASQPTSTTTPPTNSTNPPAATTTNTATTPPMMTKTSVPTNPSTGMPTQGTSWPTGYDQVGTSSNNVTHPFRSRFPKSLWTEDEVARLKQLAEQCKDQKGEIDWDRAVMAWGNTRTR